VGDPAGGDTFEDCLNKICAKNAVVRAVPEAERGAGRWPQWCWHDGTPLDPELRAAQGLTAPPPLLGGFEFGQQPANSTIYWPAAPPSSAKSASCTSFYKTPELKQLFAKTFTQDGSPVRAGKLWHQVGGHCAERDAGGLRPRSASSPLRTRDPRATKIVKSLGPTPNRRPSCRVGSITPS
jgi:hypothetical protein